MKAIIKRTEEQRPQRQAVFIAESPSISKILPAIFAFCFPSNCVSLETWRSSTFEERVTSLWPSFLWASTGWISPELQPRSEFSRRSLCIEEKLQREHSLKTFSFYPRLVISPSLSVIALPLPRTLSYRGRFLLLLSTRRRLIVASWLIGWWLVCK